MARGITEQEVFEAGDALLMRGVRPTIERVRQELGRGSPNTVNRMLDAWWSTLAQRLAGSAPAGLPASLAEACSRLYAQIRQQAVAEAEQREAEVRGTLEEDRRQLEQAQGTLTAERAGVQATLEALKGELSALRAESQAATAETVRLQTNLTEAQKHASEAELAAKLVAQERDRAVEAARKETDRVRTQWQGNETRWLREIDALRDERKQSRQAHDKQVRDLADRLKDAQRQTSELRKEVLSLRRTLNATQQQLIREREALIGAQAALGAYKKSSKQRSIPRARQRRSKSTKD